MKPAPLAVIVLGMFLFGMWYGGIMGAVIVAEQCATHGQAHIESWIFAKPIDLTCSMKGQK